MESAEFRTTPAERLERLRAQLRGAPEVKAFEGLTPSSRGANLLFGILLHGAARREAGLELTALEAGLTGPVATLLSEEELRDFGRVFAAETATRAQVFPPSVAARPLEEGYTLQDLIADLPSVREEILAQPNVTITDLDAPAGSDAEGEELARAMKAYGYGATAVTASAQEPTAQTAPKVMVKLWLDRSRMDNFSDEIGDEEIYWSTAAAADGGARQTMISRVIGGQNTGETHRIDPNTVVYYGGARNVVTYHVECWEEDHARPSELQRTLDQISRMAWEVSEAMGQFPAGTHLEATANFAALVAGVANLIKLIIAWFEDDLVAQRTFTLDRPALERIAAKPYEEIAPGFNGGFQFNGMHTLFLRISVRKLASIALHAHDGQAWTSPPRSSGATPSAPALASFGTHLYSAVQGFDNKVYVNRFDGSAWSPHVAVRYNEILSSPALAVHGGKLHLGHRTLDNKIQVTSSPDGVSWPTPPVTLPGISPDSVALGVEAGVLLCGVRGMDTKLYLSPCKNGTWLPFWEFPDVRTYYPPAMANVGNTLYMAHTGLTGKVYMFVHDGRTWSYGDVGGVAVSGPALGVRNGTVHCAVQGQDGSIWLTYRTATGWSSWEKAPGADLVSEPALAGHNGTLYTSYATATPGI
ncbi:hypothetical protein [Streptomyces californicus]|uniref:hypothetical protein n=1 Tax=Streptomyces californicus TaxID=67351 RepID=UPI0034027E95